MEQTTANNGTVLRQGWGGGRSATPGVVVQLPPQRTAKLGRAYRLVCHQLYGWTNWRHFTPGRWGGSDATVRSDSGSALATAKPDRGYQVVRLAVALVLLTAAALKGYDLATGPVAGSGLFDSHWVLIGVVEMELFLSFWLVGNVWPRMTWAAVLACFTAFTCVSFYKALSGYASCGCFGRVSVNPWYTTTLDLAIILSLLRWRPTSSESRCILGRATGWGWSRFSGHRIAMVGETGTVPVSSHACVVGVIVVWLAVGLPAAYAMTSYTPTTLSIAGDLVGSDKTVVLEPETWAGKRFPLLDFIDVGETLKDGKWLVVLYHHDCPKCLEEVPRFQDQARQSADDPDAPHVALIEIPPFGTPDALSISSDTFCVQGRLSDKKEWFVKTPAVLLVHSGVVSPIAADQSETPLETASVTPEAEPFCPSCEQSKMAAMNPNLVEGR